MPLKLENKSHYERGLSSAQGQTEKEQQFAALFLFLVELFQLMFSHHHPMQLGVQDHPCREASRLQTYDQTLQHHRVFPE